MSGPATGSEPGFGDVAELRVDPARGRVFEQGWQSWSPTATYGLTERPHRPVNANNHALAYRGDRDVPAGVFQGEGLLAVQQEPGAPVRLWSAPDGAAAVASIRAELAGANGSATLRVSADGPVDEHTDDGEGGIDGALRRWAVRYAGRAGIAAPRQAPTFWCSWYHYFTEVTERDVLDNLAVMDDLALPVDVVQLDDGYQAEVGDWLTLSGRFASLADLAGRIRDRGRRPGIWTAPLLVGARSALAAAHPDWLVGAPEGGRPCHAGHNWDQDLYALDTTHPDALGYLAEVYGTFRSYGIDFFKLDFLYAGALPGRRHAEVDPIASYRATLAAIREVVGPDAYLLGCGAPILPSAGLVDGMRVSTDIAPHYAPPDGDLSQASQQGAVLTGAARAFLGGVFWANDPDCLIVRPEVERRAEWADYLLDYDGLRGCSDALRALDDWGLSVTRRFLAGQR